MRSDLKRGQGLPGLRPRAKLVQNPPIAWASNSSGWLKEICPANCQVELKTYGSSSVWQTSLLHCGTLGSAKSQKLKLETWSN